MPPVLGDCGHRSPIDPDLVCGLHKHPDHIPHWYFRAKEATTS